MCQNSGWTISATANGAVKGLQYPKGERARQKIYRKGIKGGLDKRNQFPWHEPLLKWMAVHNYPSCSILHLYSDTKLDFLYFHFDVMYKVCLVKLSFLMDFMHFSSTPAPFQYTSKMKNENAQLQLVNISQVLIKCHTCATWLHFPWISNVYHTMNHNAIHVSCTRWFFGLQSWPWFCAIFQLALICACLFTNSCWPNNS